MGPRKGKLGARKELLWPKSPVLIQSTAEEVHVKFRKWLLRGKSLFLWRSEPSKSKFRAERKLSQRSKHFLMENGAEEGRSIVENGAMSLFR